MADYNSTENLNDESLSSGQTLKLFITALKRNLIFIIVFSVLCTAIASVYAMFKVKTTYTAEEDLMFVTEINSTTNVNTNVSLAKRHLDNLSDMIVSDKFIQHANTIYEGDGKISSRSVGVSYNDTSLIFKIRYSDLSENLAKEKLSAIISSAKSNLQEYFIGTKVDLKAVQREPVVKSGNSFYKYVLVGFFGGLVLSVIFAVLKSAFSVVVNTEEDLEKITGVSLLGTLDDVYANPPKRKHKSNSKNKSRSK